MSATCPRLWSGQPPRNFTKPPDKEPYLILYFTSHLYPIHLQAAGCAVIRIGAPDRQIKEFFFQQMVAAADVARAVKEGIEDAVVEVVDISGG